MEVWASVDIISGKVVRLVRGDPNQSIVYSDDPISVARRWAQLGFDGIHIVDLDAALGRGNNFDSIKKIAENVNLPIQVGGGIRTVEIVCNYMSAGISKFVLGTVVFKKPDVFNEMLKKFGPERFVVALDFKGDNVVVEGWRSDTGTKVVDAMLWLMNKGVRRFLLTDVERDGTLLGPGLKTIIEATNVKGASIYAAGGISSIDDVVILGKIGVKGVILGRSIYEGMINIEDLLSIVRGL
ncbi:MAG: 1-(5-phosphoribosyl)-5-[(5-phosphoribosylamino)methylideneamino]imidazole-4-carboxamide isomerase [Thaumarchaeota archaeon]|jgi:phosphoribosylformimino-5-aminoimidazole carboxamide ribotide isomerase|nr:1-(5-phosphoribosyl)-5-[(5-phosphoribosylamino)methylideneamino]imidazole-4-carboxamide isomerase [Candidatus Terraquivivens yellowstonensis]MCL7392156.1 1-(5-phosphoribosyl)-5-[(5-phosphoribosylamino)methylideneamino]imidazole-4-carboxamide isomerase [Candidatus Terraquivivens yellowstonensis]MCL7395118.1 1-(5-phosphoribosyl)-5-[(5-phosphoribosylamino)methylideneamino]imidazole-4-carboxamide isomerase [Candidatus Terraquivivens yellowstonensis]MCL7397958.1 1-(5-phosphoribosyl)-5-[(5-phosphor